MDSGGYMNKINSLHTVIAVWLNASQRSPVGVGMNRSASG